MKLPLCTRFARFFLVLISGVFLAAPGLALAQGTGHHHKKPPAQDTDDAATPAPAESPKTDAVKKPTSADEAAPSKAAPDAKTGSPAKNAAAGRRYRPLSPAKSRASTRSPNRSAN